MGGGMPFAFAADVMGVVWHATMLFSTGRGRPNGQWTGLSCLMSGKAFKTHLTGHVRATSAT